MREVLKSIDTNLLAKNQRDKIIASICAALPGSHSFISSNIDNLNGIELTILLRFLQLTDKQKDDILYSKESANFIFLVGKSNFVSMFGNAERKYFEFKMLIASGRMF